MTHTPTPIDQALIFALYLQHAYATKPHRAATLASERYGLEAADRRAVFALTGAADPGVIGSGALYHAVAAAVR